MMDSLIHIHRSCIPSEPSRLAYILAPGTLVRLGPDLDNALASVIAGLEAALSPLGKARHLATTYSLANITIVLDFPGPNENDQFQVFRLRHQGKTLVGCQDPGLSKRIREQLQSIQRYHPNIEVPFSCIEDWDGLGSKDHTIYETMAAASTSVDTWKAFKDSFRRKQRLLRETRSQ